MWVLSEVREKVCDFQKLPLDKSHFITEVSRELASYYMAVFTKNETNNFVKKGGESSNMSTEQQKSQHFIGD